MDNNFFRGGGGAIISFNGVLTDIILKNMETQCGELAFSTEIIGQVNLFLCLIMSTMP
jgi:hypothetical protein